MIFCFVDDIMVDKDILKDNIKKNAHTYVMENHIISKGGFWQIGMLWVA